MRPKFLKNLIQRQEFHPSPFFGVLINPFYIIRSRLNRSISQYANQIQGNVLDVGCGSKPYQEFFKNCKYTGLDVEMSRKRFGEKVDVYFQGNELPFETGSFDAAVSFEVLEHVPNTDLFLNELNRVLKPNGKLLLTVPFSWEEHEVPHDYYRFTSFGLNHVLKKNGFKVLAHEKSTLGLLAIIQLLTGNWVVSILKRPKLTFYLFQLLWIAPIHFLILGIAKIFPGQNQLYLNNVVLAERI